MTTRESPPAGSDAPGRRNPTRPAAGGDDASAGRSANDHEIADEFEKAPNYLVRRGIAIGGVVATIAAGAIVVGALLDRGGDDEATGAADVQWNTIVLVDERSGQVIVADEAGVEQGRYPSGITNPADALAVGSTLVVTSPDGAAIVDLVDETSQTVDLEQGAGAMTMPAGSALTMLTATTIGDRVLLVHGPTGDLLDTDHDAPIAGARYDVATAVSSPSGRDVLITDSGNFQTVLFSFDRDEPAYFPGRALAVSDDLVVTTQNIGNEASVTVFDHDGSAVTDARTPSVRAGMIVGDGVILITVDGEIMELTTSNGTTSTLGALEVGTVQTGHVATSGARLIITGDAGTAIVDDGGTVLRTFAGGTPLDTGIDELAPRTSSCVAVTIAPDSELVVGSLDDGSIVAEADGGVPALSSVDGCTVVVGTSVGLDVINAQGVDQRAADGDLVAVAPDAVSAVTESPAGRLILVDLTSPSQGETSTSVPGTVAPDDLEDPNAIDLGPASRLVLFTQR